MEKYLKIHDCPDKKPKVYEGADQHKVMLSEHKNE